MKLNARRWAWLLLWGLLTPFAPAAVLIDHTCTDPSLIPSNYILQAKAAFRVGYGHTSHGSQIVTGMENLRDESGSLYEYTRSGWGPEPGVFLNDYWGNAGGADDLGHNGDLAWRDATIALLGAAGNDRNVVMWSWCGGVSDNTAAGINAYLQAMNALEAAYPSVKFVYMTGHLDGSGTAGTLHQMNNLIRTYCRDHNKILFDFADIESYDPDGNYFLDRGADDGCSYSGGNWANEYCAAHPGSALCRDCGGDDCCAHSRPLNCNLKGRAFWWMMARLAGWDGATPIAGPWSGVAEQGGGWKQLPWFGWFIDAGGNWIWHTRHDWMYGSGSLDNLWLWTQDMGWWWTRDAVYPYAYRASDGAWLWYQAGSDNPRWFYNTASALWEAH